jgi:hypothetical protein
LIFITFLLGLAETLDHRVTHTRVLANRSAIRLTVAGETVLACRDERQLSIIICRDKWRGRTGWCEGKQHSCRSGGGTTGMTAPLPPANATT